MFVKIKNSSLIFLFFLLIIFSCDKEKSTTNLEEIQKVKTIKVTKERFLEDLNTFGTISYKTKNDITVLVEGTISKLFVKEGDFVRKGQIIAELKNIQLEIQQEQAFNSLESAKSSLVQCESNLISDRLNVESRLLSLEKSKLNLEQLQLELKELKSTLEKNRELLYIGGITESSFKSMELNVTAKETDVKIMEKEIEISSLGFRDIDLINNGYEISQDVNINRKNFIELNTSSSRANVESAKSNVLNAEKNLYSAQKLIDELKIKAVTDGIVGATYFEEGEFVPEKEKIITLMNVSTVDAIFSIQEQDIQYFDIGNSLSVEITSLNKIIDCKISEISPIADSASGNFTVKASIKNHDNSIKPGMFVKCNIKRNDTIEYCCIPETTLLQKEGNLGFVFSVVNNFVVQKEINILKNKNGKLWIDNGIKDGELIVDKPSPFLKEGEKVEIY